MELGDNSSEAIARIWARLEYEKCKRDPAFYIKNFVMTADEHAAVDPIKPFPFRPYVPFIIEAWKTESILHIAKSRQMAMSWLACAMLLWESQFHEYRTSVIINKALDDSIKGLSRAKLIYNHQPVWLKNLCPLDRKMRDFPVDLLAFKNGSQLVALPQGAAKIRGMVPYTVLLDECAFQEEAEATYSAAVPCSKRIVTISSAGPGFFEKLCREA